MFLYNDQLEILLSADLHLDIQRFILLQYEFTKNPHRLTASGYALFAP
ncbi:hypothetical protein yrohd0001_19040 [Yersinia rohdei ATCC 43380]|nr:hypothetical protein yrohd0001_19040 [Yersinia rohdei ATCC 43380]